MFEGRFWAEPCHSRSSPALWTKAKPREACWKMTVNRSWSHAAEILCERLVMIGTRSFMNSQAGVQHECCRSNTNKAVQNEQQVTKKSLCFIEVSSKGSSRNPTRHPWHPYDTHGTHGTAAKELRWHFHTTQLPRAHAQQRISEGGRIVGRQGCLATDWPSSAVKQLQ